MRMTDVMSQGESLSIHDGLAFVLGRPDFRAQVAHCFSCIVFEHQEAGRKMLQAHQHDMVAFPNGWCKAACFEFHDPFEILLAGLAQNKQWMMWHWYQYRRV